MFFNHGSAGSRGVAILFGRDFHPSVTAEVSDLEGRFLLLDISDSSASYLVGSVYAPTQDKPREQSLFLDYLEEALDEMENPDILLGGDFNCILSPQLDKNSQTTYDSQERRDSRSEEGIMLPVWTYFSHPPISPRVLFTLTQKLSLNRTTLSSLFTSRVPPPQGGPDFGDSTPRSLANQTLCTKFLNSWNVGSRLQNSRTPAPFGSGRNLR